MTWLIYVDGRRGPSPQIVYDGVVAPVVGEGIKGLVLQRHKLSTDEDALVRVGRLSLDELVKRYPPPGGRADGVPTPPKSPAPIAPKPAGEAQQLEVA